jgi:hypothetical protein
LVYRLVASQIDSETQKITPPCNIQSFQALARCNAHTSGAIPFCG